jgi:hypothetical protein
MGLCLGVGAYPYLMPRDAATNYMPYEARSRITANLHLGVRQNDNSAYCHDSSYSPIQLAKIC